MRFQKLKLLKEKDNKDQRKQEKNLAKKRIQSQFYPFSQKKRNYPRLKREKPKLKRLIQDLKTLKSKFQISFLKKKLQAHFEIENS